MFPPGAGTPVPGGGGDEVADLIISATFRSHPCDRLCDLQGRVSGRSEEGPARTTDPPRITYQRLEGASLPPDRPQGEGPPAGGDLTLKGRRPGNEQKAGKKEKQPVRVAFFFPGIS